MNSRPNSKSSWLASLGLTLVVLALLTGPTEAQESRGAITGRLSDPSGAVIPGAKIVLTHAATNTTVSTATNEEGNYTVLYLLPGEYTVTVEVTGFRKLVQQGIEVRVGDRLTLDLQLETGAIDETITVTGESAPLLDIFSASSGQVVDRRRISELPLADGNPLVLVRLAPTTTVTGGFTSLSALSSSGPSNFTVEGSVQGGNEFTLDGSPNTADRGGNQRGQLRVGFQPPTDAVQEFKVVTTNFDAQLGHTAGASVDMAIRSGTNEFHGSLYEFVRNDVLSANTFFLNRNPFALDENGKSKREVRRYNRFGGTVGGPLWFPKKAFGPLGYKGRDRSFFFVSYEEIRTSQPDSETLTLPSAALRSGDFSSLPAGQFVYDPSTARLSEGRVVRDPIQCNERVNVICPERLSPIARAYLSFLPLPNQPGTESNFLGSTSAVNDYYAIITRFDHTFNNRHRMFFRFSNGQRTEMDENTVGTVNGVRTNGRFIPRGNRGGVYDHVYTASPTTIFNLRVGYTRFLQTRTAFTDFDVDLTGLGFSQAYLSQVGLRRGLPQFNVSGFSSPVEQTGFFTADRAASFQPTVTKIAGNHALRFGYDFRVYQEARRDPQFLAGSFAFSNVFTRVNDLNTSVPVDLNRAQSLAALLLGQPTGGSLPRPVQPANQSRYHGLFVHDDWKVTRRLTLNLGLRFDYDEATTERFNRNIRGFDLTSANPVEAAARANYAANPIPEVAPADFRIRGGLVFVDERNRGFFRSDGNNFQPRIGFAFEINSKTVLRGGFGLYTIPFTLDAINPIGFSVVTPVDPSPDNGLTFSASLANPFPAGLNQPTGSSQGLATFLGQSLAFAPVERKNGQSQRYELSLQRELPGRWLLEATYLGNRGYDLTTNLDINPVPRQYLSLSPIRDTERINFLTANVSNPFRGIAAFRGTAFFTNATLQRQQLLRPFPQFGNVTGQLYDGSSSFHSAQFRLEKRFTGGYTFLATYAFSKLLERVDRLNPTDADYERRLGAADSPHRLNFSGIYELPFGRGRKFGTSWSAWKEALFGGFQVQGLYLWQTGTPLTLGNIYFNGNLSDLKVKIKGSTIGALGTSNVTDNVFLSDLSRSGFYFSDAAVQTNGVVDSVKQRNDPRINLTSNLRTLPSRASNLRNQPVNLADLSIIKNFALNETVKLQLRLEALNAFNHWLFNGPDLNPRNASFGRVTNSNPVALPREYQIGLKLLF